jgi:hypothetical protein
MVPVFLKFKTRHAYFNFIFKMIPLITKFLVFFVNNHQLCIRIDFQMFCLEIYLLNYLCKVIFMILFYFIFFYGLISNDKAKNITQMS